jgi:N-acetylmuramoyl-L-alanine amidase
MSFNLRQTTRSAGPIGKALLAAVFFMTALPPIPWASAAPVGVATPRLASAQSKTDTAARRVTAKSKKPSARISTIDNLRFTRSSKQTRLVFDLARAIKYTQHRIEDPDQVVIDLKNAALSKAAKRTVENDGFPGEIDIKQTQPGLVRVTLDMEGVTGFKLRALTKPNRLVMDYFPRSDSAARASRPKVTLPPVARQITEAERKARLDIETIVLDPGHGGKDSGALGRSGLMEKDVVLDVALRLGKLLRDRLGKNVLLTRDKDEFIELDDRAKFANRHKADLFVSIHINSHPKRTARGLEMYHFGIASDRRAMEVAARENGDAIDYSRDFVDMIKADLALSKRIEESQNLAWEAKLAVVNLVAPQYGLDDHGVKTAPFYVLRYTAMPSILAELSFISNPVEEKRLRMPVFRQKMAEGLYEGIRNYLNSVQVASAR